MNQVRRKLIGCAASVLLVATPSLAQTPVKFRVVIRMPGTEKDQRDFGWVMSERLGESLARFGYVEGKNLLFVNQFEVERKDVLPGHVAQINAEKTHAIVVVGVWDAVPVQKSVKAIPIVAWGIEDPVRAGLARSFVQPGGNITGLTQSKDAVFAKQVDFLRKMVPDLAGVAVFGYLRATTHPDVRLQFEMVEKAVRTMGLKYVLVPGTGAVALKALETLRSQGYQAAIYFHNPDPLGRETQRIHAEAAIRHRIATVGYFANMADDGFLASYGELDDDLFLRLAQQLDRVLRGGNPGDIPFMAPQRFHLRVNRRTANALGLAIAPEVLILANEVVE